MKLFTDCDYLNWDSDHEMAPKSGECEDCYRYTICKEAYDKAHRKEGGKKNGSKH